MRIKYVDLYGVRIKLLCGYKPAQKIYAEVRKGCYSDESSSVVTPFSKNAVFCKLMSIRTEDICGGPYYRCFWRRAMRPRLKKTRKTCKPTKRLVAQTTNPSSSPLISHFSKSLEPKRNGSEAPSPPSPSSSSSPASSVVTEERGEAVVSKPLTSRKAPKKKTRVKKRAPVTVAALHAALSEAAATSIPWTEAEAEAEAF